MKHWLREVIQPGRDRARIFFFFFRARIWALVYLFGSLGFVHLACIVTITMGTWKHHPQPHFQVEKALVCGALLPSAGEKKKNLPLKLTSAELGHRGARGAEALVHILRRQRCQGLINEDLASRDLKMPAFAQVFLPENTELVPGIDAAQKGHSRLLLNEMFCSQHTSFYRHGEKIETRRTKKLSFSGWAGRSAAKFKDRPEVGQAPAACCWGNWGLSWAWAITFLLAVVQSLGCVWLFETPWIAAH